MLSQLSGNLTSHPGSSGTQTMVTAERLLLSAWGSTTASIALSGRQEISHHLAWSNPIMTRNFCQGSTMWKLQQACTWRPYLGITQAKQLPNNSSLGWRKKSLLAVPSWAQFWQMNTSSRERQIHWLAQMNMITWSLSLAYKQQAQKSTARKTRLFLVTTAYTEKTQNLRSTFITMILAVSQKVVKQPTVLKAPHTLLQTRAQTTQSLLAVWWTLTKTQFQLDLQQASTKNVLSWKTNNPWPHCQVHSPWTLKWRYQTKK